MTALTLYLQNAAAPYTPDTKRGAWDDATATFIKGLGAKSGVSANTSAAVGTTNADFDYLLARYVSAPLGASAIFTGTIDGVLGLFETDAAVNARLHLHVFVLAGSTDTLRGTLWADYVDADEASTTAVTSGEGFSGTMLDVVASAGDTIVVEVGARCNATTTSGTVYTHLGSTDATDLADGGDPQTYPGWIRLACTDGSLGAGALSTAAVTVTGTGSVTITGSGAITVSNVAVGGSGTRTAPAAWYTWPLRWLGILPPPVARTGTGAVQVGSVSVSGAGSVTITGSGAISIGAIQVAGAGSNVAAPTACPGEVGSGLCIINSLTGDVFINGLSGDVRFGNPTGEVNLR
jgi:hypothetical protein